jgi:hypothetical protein
MTDTIKTATELSSHEVQTRQLFNGKAWSSERQAITNIFIAFSGSSFPADKIAQISGALYGMGREDIIQAALTSFVKEKVLRSRMLGGQRLYEVNY